MYNLIIILLISVAVNLSAQNQIIKDFTATQCDSMINANIDNPNFVILDIRTPNEYIPQHLEGAIMRDFYDADFKEQLDKLDKEKTYVMHCRSGGRSGSALKTFKSLGFKDVYNMLGGINSWNRSSFTTTKEFAPRIMLVTETDQDLGNVQIGATQKAIVTITNRENDKLILSDISATMGPEFSTDFVKGTELEGAEDYSFNVTYKPANMGNDIITYTVESNAGNIDFDIEATGVMSTATSETSSFNSTIVYPNPVVSKILFIDGLPDDETLFRLINTSGQVVFSQKVYGSDIRIVVPIALKGIYSLILSSKNEFIATKRIIVE